MNLKDALRRFRVPRKNAATAVTTAVCAVTYIVAFSLCHDATSTLWWLTLLPAVTAGWTWGMRRGFVVGLITFPVDALLLAIGGLSGWQLSTDMPGGLLHAAAPLLGAICGRLHELSTQLLAERERRRQSDRELQLTRRSLDATVRLLNDQATVAHRHLQDKGRAEEENERSQRELERIRVRLTRTSLTDIDTELPNRRVAVDRLRREWSAAHSKNRPLSCIVVRLDEPLRLRAMHGQQTADHVLRETLDVLRASVRQSDELFSLGGDEFLIVCPNAELSAAAECAERLRALVEVNTIPAGDVVHHLTVSAGVAANDREVRSADELIRAAQQALYDAQQVGRNRVACFEGPAVVWNPLSEIGAVAAIR